MAKEKRTVKVKAKINLKYDKEVVKAGQEFLVRKSDIESIEDCVEVLEEIEENKGAGTNQDNDGNKE